MSANLEKDKYFLDLVTQGIFTVSYDGTVTRVSTGFNSWSVNSGYKKVHFKDKSILLHRLVWLAFNGNIPSNLVINHIDGVKTNCQLDNLELVTHGRNLQHAIDTGLRICVGTRNFGQSNSQALFKDVDVIRLRSKFTRKELTIEQISKEYDTTFRNVKTMLSGTTYSHLPGICKVEIRRGRRPKIVTN